MIQRLQGLPQTRIKENESDRRCCHLHPAQWPKILRVGDQPLAKQRGLTFIVVFTDIHRLFFEKFHKILRYRIPLHLPSNPRSQCVVVSSAFTRQSSGWNPRLTSEMGTTSPSLPVATIELSDSLRSLHFCIISARKWAPTQYTARSPLLTSGGHLIALIPSWTFSSRNIFLPGLIDAKSDHFHPSKNLTSNHSVRSFSTVNNSLGQLSIGP